MLENDRSCLFAMTGGTAFVSAGHGQSARRLEDVAAVGIVALHAIHTAFQHRMVVRGLKFALGGEMALQARRRILAGVDDEFEAAARLDVFAAGSVTRFAPGITVFAQGGEMNAGMGLAESAARWAHDNTGKPCCQLHARRE